MSLVDRLFYRQISRIVVSGITWHLKKEEKYRFFSNLLDNRFVTHDYGLPVCNVCMHVCYV